MTLISWSNFWKTIYWDSLSLPLSSSLLLSSLPSIPRSLPFAFSPPFMQKFSLSSTSFFHIYNVFHLPFRITCFYLRFAYFPVLIYLALCFFLIFSCLCPACPNISLYFLCMIFFFFSPTFRYCTSSSSSLIKVYLIFTWTYLLTHLIRPNFISCTL